MKLTEFNKKYPHKNPRDVIKNKYNAKRTHNHKFFEWFDNEFGLK